MNAALPLSAMAQAQQQAWLQNTYGFNQMDLLANRAGRLSASQQQNLFRTGLLALIFSLVFPLICIVPIGLLSVASLFFASSGVVLFGLFLCPASCMYLLTLLALPTGMQRLQDARAGQALVVAGQCRIFQTHHIGRRGFGHTTTTCMVGGQALTLRGRALSSQAVAHMQGQAWRCYYAPHTKFLMSIEQA